MFEKVHFTTLLLHIYILTYLIVTMADAPESVMQIMHIICPFIVVPFLYHSIKSTAPASEPAIADEKEESYEAL